jgi:hypothetical protein
LVPVFAPWPLQLSKVALGTQYCILHLLCLKKATRVD